MPSGQRPTFCDSLTVMAKEAGLVLGRQADAQQHDWPAETPGQKHLQSNGGPVGEPNDQSQRCAVAISPAARASPGTDTSSVRGAPAIPGRVVATRRTPDNAGSAITRSKERAALAPPGRRRTDRSDILQVPAINNSQASRMDLPALRRTLDARLPIGFEVHVVRRRRTRRSSDSRDSNGETAGDATCRALAGSTVRSSATRPSGSSGQTAEIGLIEVAPARPGHRVRRWWRRWSARPAPSARRYASGDHDQRQPERPGLLPGPGIPPGGDPSRRRDREPDHQAADPARGRRRHPDHDELEFERPSNAGPAASVSRTPEIAPGRAYASAPT